jgi:hypothetical protein
MNNRNWSTVAVRISLLLLCSSSIGGDAATSGPKVDSSRSGSSNASNDATSGTVKPFESSRTSAMPSKFNEHETDGRLANDSEWTTAPPHSNQTQSIKTTSSLSTTRDQDLSSDNWASSADRSIDGQTRPSVGRKRVKQTSANSKRLTSRRTVERANGESNASRRSNSLEPASNATFDDQHELYPIDLNGPQTLELSSFRGVVWPGLDWRQIGRWFIRSNRTTDHDRSTTARSDASRTDDGLSSQQQPEASELSSSDRNLAALQARLESDEPSLNYDRTQIRFWLTVNSRIKNRLVCVRCRERLLEINWQLLNVSTGASKQLSKSSTNGSNDWVGLYWTIGAQEQVSLVFC